MAPSEEPTVRGTEGLLKPSWEVVVQGRPHQLGSASSSRYAPTSEKSPGYHGGRAKAQQTPGMLSGVARHL